MINNLLLIVSGGITDFAYNSVLEMNPIQANLNICAFFPICVQYLSVYMISDDSKREFCPCCVSLQLFTNLLYLQVKSHLMSA